MIRAYADNVIIRLEEQAKETRSGIAIVRSGKPGTRGHRTAIVVAVGPGHYVGCRSCGGERGHFEPTSVRVGERVVVDELAGDKMKWDWDNSAVRQNENPEMDSLLGERGEYRIVREAEILAVVEAGAEIAA